MEKKMNKRYNEIASFLWVGAVTFMADYVILFVLTEYLGMYFLCSSACSFLIALILNYFLCVRFVFKPVNKQSWQHGIIFILFSLSGLLLNQLLMWFFVSIAGMYYMAAKIFSACLVTIWNFLTKRKAVMLEVQQ